MSRSYGTPGQPRAVFGFTEEQAVEIATRVLFRGERTVRVMPDYSGIPRAKFDNLISLARREQWPLASLPEVRAERPEAAAPSTLALVPSAPSPLDRGSRHADAYVCRIVWGRDVTETVVQHETDFVWASGPDKGKRIPDVTTSTTAMWLLFRRMRELGLAEEFAQWLSLRLHAVHEHDRRKWRGDLYEFIYGETPAALSACRAAVELLAETEGRVAV